MNLTPPQSDAVVRALEAGTLRSAEKLAALTRRSWTVGAETLSNGPSPRFRTCLGSSVKPHVGALFSMTNGGPLSVLIVFSAPHSALVSRAFTQGMGDWIKNVADVERHAVGEIANIMSHAAMGALADALKTSIILSAPRLARGPRLSLLDAALREFPEPDSFIMLSRVRLAAEETVVDAGILILCGTRFLRSLFASAGAAE